MATTVIVRIVRRGEAFVYVEDLDAYVHFVRDDVRYFGKLDRAGNFIPADTGSKRFGLYSGYPLKQVNLPRSRGPTWRDFEVVYEFRSGYLIRGRLIQSGDFIPAEGSRVIRFEDYRYTPDAPRIYNLPGRLVPADQAPKVESKKGASVSRTGLPGPSAEHEEAVRKRTSAHR